jgi:hypothetical protein
MAVKDQITIGVKLKALKTHVTVGTYIPAGTIATSEDELCSRLVLRCRLAVG